MRKVLSLLFLLFICVADASLQARTRLFDSLLEKLSATGMDTAYAIQPERPFMLTARMTSTLNALAMEWQETDNELNLYARPLFKLGAYISYRSLEIGFQKDVRSLFNKSSGDNLELTISSYGRKLGGDFSYSTSSDFTLQKVNDVRCDKDIDGIRSKRIYANVYYVFNNKKFSYPAALTQCHRQKRSCGSLVVGVTFLYNDLEMDPQGLSEATGHVVMASQFVDRTKYNRLSVNGGYAYNWVPNRHWMFHGTIMPSVSLVNKLEYSLLDNKQEDKNSKDPGCIIRLGALWDNDLTFASITTLMYVNKTDHDPMAMTDFYMKTQISYGIRF